MKTASKVLLILELIALILGFLVQAGAGGVAVIGTWYAKDVETYNLCYNLAYILLINLLWYALPLIFTIYGLAKVNHHKDGNSYLVGGILVAIFAGLIPGILMIIDASDEKVSNAEDALLEEIYDHDDCDCCNHEHDEECECEECNEEHHEELDKKFKEIDEKMKALEERALKAEKEAEKSKERALKAEEKLEKAEKKEHKGFFHFGKKEEKVEEESKEEPVAQEKVEEKTEEVEPKEEKTESFSSGNVEIEVIDKKD